MDFKKIIEDTIVPIIFPWKKKRLAMMLLINMLIVSCQINYIVLELALKEI